MAGPGATTASERTADTIAVDILISRSEVLRQLGMNVPFGDIAKALRRLP